MPEGVGAVDREPSRLAGREGGHVALQDGRAGRIVAPGEQRAGFEQGERTMAGSDPDDAFASGTSRTWRALPLPFPGRSVEQGEMPVVVRGQSGVAAVGR